MVGKVVIIHILLLYLTKHLQELNELQKECKDFCYVEYLHVKQELHFWAVQG